MLQKLHLFVIPSSAGLTSSSITQLFRREWMPGVMLNWISLFSIVSDYLLYMLRRSCVLIWNILDILANRPYILYVLDREGLSETFPRKSVEIFGEGVFVCNHGTRISWFDNGFQETNTTYSRPRYAKHTGVERTMMHTQGRTYLEPGGCGIINRAVRAQGTGRLPTTSFFHASPSNNKVESRSVISRPNYGVIKRNYVPPRFPRNFFLHPRRINRLVWHDQWQNTIADTSPATPATGTSRDYGCINRTRDAF